MWEHTRVLPYNGAMRVGTETRLCPKFDGKLLPLLRQRTRPAHNHAHTFMGEIHWLTIINITCGEPLLFDVET